MSSLQNSIPSIKEKISSNAQVWIHAFNRPLMDDEISELTKLLDEFIPQWQSHKKTTPGHYEIRYGQFVILANENDLGGCSIDSSFRVIKEFGEKLEQSSPMLSTTPKIFYRNQNNEIIVAERYKIASLVKNNLITPDTVVFDPTITRWQDYKDRWEIVANKTWLKQYFK